MHGPGEPVQQGKTDLQTRGLLLRVAMLRILVMCVAGETQGKEALLAWQNASWACWQARKRV